MCVIAQNNICPSYAARPDSTILRYTRVHMNHIMIVHVRSRDSLSACAAVTPDLQSETALGLVKSTEDAVLPEVPTPEGGEIDPLRIRSARPPHFVTHSWFGGIVTQTWWNEYWLSEGFSAYFENFGASPIG